MDRVAIIAEHFKASASIGIASKTYPVSSLWDPYKVSCEKISRADRGLYSEWLCVSDAARRGKVLLAHRESTPFAEVDLIFFEPKNHHIEIVEVKSVASLEWLEDVLGKAQKRRLKNVHQYFTERMKFPVQLLLAVVSHQGEIVWLDDFL